jgi:hypothetical protein
MSCFCTEKSLPGPGGDVGHELWAERFGMPDEEGDASPNSPGRYGHLEPTPEELDRWDEEWRAEWDSDRVDDAPAYDPASAEHYDPYQEFDWEELTNDDVPDEEDFWMPE